VTADLATPTECIRRPNSLWTTCECPDCHGQRRKLAKRRLYGYYHRPDGNAAITRIRDWRAQGYSILWIASACDVNKAWVLTVDNGTVTKPGPILTAKVLAADIRNGSEGMCSALGSQRRLRSLAVMGWNLNDLRARYGISTAALSRIRNGEAVEVWAERYHLIAKAYRELSGTRGPSEQGATRARNAGWVPPAAWDDEAIDDPEATPDVGTDVLTPSQRHAENVADLLAHDPYATLHRLADRLGMSANGLHVALTRAGRVDLRDQLSRNAELEGHTVKRRAS